jgi:inner membrane protein
MMAKAHITVGMAAAFTAARPETIPEALPVITGSALGCLICDLDCDTKAEMKNSNHWRIVMLIVALAALIEDYLTGGDMWATFPVHGSYLCFAGLAGFMLTCIFASISSHRGFSHSLLARALETSCIWLVFPTASLPFAVAFATHVILDLTNKKPVRLLYPSGKGFSLGWFYADRLADKVFASAGVIWMVLLFAASI